MALVLGDRPAAEMLHTFFRLMDFECSLVPPDSGAVATLRRLCPDVLILDFDLPDLRALEIARELRDIPAILLTSGDVPPATFGAPVIPKPRAHFEELLGLFEVVLALDPPSR